MKYMAHDTSVGAGSLTVDECDTPDYNKDQEVLIKVESTAVNRADLLQVSKLSFAFNDSMFLAVTRKIPTTTWRYEHHWP